MQIVWKIGNGTHGTSRGVMTFSNDRLRGFEWPVFEIAGRYPGPHLCVMAGVHVNEACSIEAAYQLAESQRWEGLRGRVSIIPVVNIPGCYEHQATIPVDGKNLHWLYPGNAAGSFSDALADALIRDWAKDADALIDMHGGDVGEDLTTYVVYQRCADTGRCQRNLGIARSFNPPLIFGLPVDMIDRPGRSCSAMAARGRLGLVSEAGKNALLDLDHAGWHAEGVINAARELGMLPGTITSPAVEPVILSDYRFLTAPNEGLIYPEVGGGDAVARGQLLATMRDLHGACIAEIVAPASGWIMWITTRLLVGADEWIAGFGLHQDV